VLKGDGPQKLRGAMEGKENEVGDDKEGVAWGGGPPEVRAGPARGSKRGQGKGETPTGRKPSPTRQRHQIGWEKGEKGVEENREGNRKSPGTRGRSFGPQGPPIQESNKETG